MMGKGNIKETMIGFEFVEELIVEHSMTNDKIEN